MEMKHILLLLGTIGANSFIQVLSQNPNVIVFLADDMGYGDAGCYGGTMVPTPNIDRLANEGIRCTNAYVTAPISGPSRYGILTGAYQQRFGIQDNCDAWAKIEGDPVRIPDTQKMLNETLQDAGYHTAIFGKFNLPNYPRTTFDEQYSLMHFGGDYFPDEHGHYLGVDEVKATSSSKRYFWGPERESDEYLTDRIGRQAVEFIQRNRNTPFFMYIGFNAPHSPMQAKKKHQKLVKHLPTEALRFYAAMLYSMDENIGRILQTLDDLELADNTLIVFLSDNGPSYAYNVDWPNAWPRELLGSAGKLSGYKGQMYEGGIRVPCIFRYPNLLGKGKISDQPISSLDIYPTICSVIGAPLPNKTIIDGINLMPYLMGKDKTDLHRTLYWLNGVSGALREGKWKILVHGKNVSLFDLEIDEVEKVDLSKQYPLIVQKLFEKWNSFRNQMPVPCNQIQRKKISMKNK